jgi:hypothetical protein
MNFGSRTVCFGCGKAKEGEKEKEEQEEEICVICMENRIDTVIKVCGHFGCCGLCALNMYKCPICRAAYNPDVDLLKVYKV